MTVSSNAKVGLSHLILLIIVLVGIGYAATRPTKLRHEDAVAAGKLMTDRYKIYGIALLDAPFVITSDNHMDGNVIFKDDDGKLASLKCSGDLNNHDEVVVKCDPNSLQK